LRALIALCRPATRDAPVAGKAELWRAGASVVPDRDVDHGRDPGRLARAWSRQPCGSRVGVALRHHCGDRRLCRSRPRGRSDCPTDPLQPPPVRPLQRGLV